MAYHSVPLQSQSQSRGEQEAGDRDRDGDGDASSLVHVRDMLQEVKLMHLHPSGAFGETSGHSPPDCLVYQVEAIYI